MKIDRRYRIEEATAGKGEVRTCLQSMYLETEKRRLIATDGHILSVVPVDVSETDTTGYIPVEAVTTQRKLVGKKVEHLELNCNGAISLSDGRTFPRGEHGPYPNVDMVVPKPETRNFKVGFNVSLLSRLAEAMGAEILELQFDTERPTGAILVKGPASNEAFGVLMPVRAKS